MKTQPPDDRSKRYDDDRPDVGSSAIVQKSHEVTENVKHAALERVEGVKRSAYAMRDDASGRVREFGAIVRKVGEHFRVEDQQYVAEHMTNASLRLGKLADYVDAAEPGKLVRDVRNLARGNSAVFLGGAFLLGLGAGRFLKGTSLMTSPMPSNSRRSERERSASNRAADDDADDDKALIYRSEPKPRRDKNARAHNGETPRVSR